MICEFFVGPRFELWAGLHSLSILFETAMIAGPYINLMPATFFASFGPIFFGRQTEPRIGRLVLLIDGQCNDSLRATNAPDETCDDEACSLPTIT